MAARGETHADVEVSTLVVPAWRLRWTAPELALVLGERALALASARHDEADRLRAEALVVFAGNRVGRGVRIADRALDALKAAQAAGEYETGWLLRVELAACARSVGAPLTGFAAVTPVLEAPDVPAELRASALVQASECLVTVGRGDEPTRALAEADQLYVADTTLDEDTRLLLRSLIRAVQAAQHRRWGDIAAAISTAREGLDLLSRLADPSADSGQALGRLTLELVLALMDANRLLDASDMGTPILDRPVRAPSASTAGWLRLALATRVHLPAGRVALARGMLRDAAASAERHQLDTLLAESLLALAHVHEVSGELAEALTNLRAAHAAERRRARAVYAVRARLAAEFSGVHRQPADLHRQLAELLRPLEGQQPSSDGVLPAALKQQLRQWRPVQVRKGDGLKVKRVRRAAEDMTVEGLSAARAHAADRWRMVQPFGDPDDGTPAPLELEPLDPPSASQSDRTVSAAGLIASAGAMVSGRRRAARVAAGEIDENQPQAQAPQTRSQPVPPAPATPEPSSASGFDPEQERKRKVEQQLMELQREARRQIEAERAERRAQAEREAEQAAAEAARQEAARQEAAREEAARQDHARQVAARQEALRQEGLRQEAARQEAARQEAARQEAARQEAARQEAARQEAARQAAEREEAAREEAARAEAACRDADRQDFLGQEAVRAEAVRREEQQPSQSESVLDMLRAQGLRSGGRRRAPDAGAADQPESSRSASSQSASSQLDSFQPESWRVEPPSRLRQPEQEPAYFDIPDIRASPDSTGSTPAAFAAEPSQQDFFADPANPAGGHAEKPAAQDFFSGAHSAAASEPETPNYFADTGAPGESESPGRPGRSGLAAAFSRPPAAPDFGPHLDEPSQGFGGIEPVPPFQPDTAESAFRRQGATPDYAAPAYPQSTPPHGFPAADEPASVDELNLPALDFSSIDFSGLSTSIPQADEPWQTASVPNPEPAERPAPAEPSPDREPSSPSLPPIPDPVPSVPIPDEVPQAPEPDLLSSTFLSSADVDDDIADLPTGRVSARAVRESAAAAHDAQAATDSRTTSGSRHDSHSSSESGSGQGTAGGSRSSGGSDTYSSSESGSGPGGAGGSGGYFSPEAPETGAAPESQGSRASQAAPADQDGLGDQADSAGRSTATDQPGRAGGRPSSRRKPSDLSIADLLTEALVAYETGRRSDEEQVDAVDLAAPEWAAAEPAAPADVAAREWAAEPSAPADFAAPDWGANQHADSTLSSPPLSNQAQSSPAQSSPAQSSPAQYDPAQYGPAQSDRIGEWPEPFPPVVLSPPMGSEPEDTASGHTAPRHTALGDSAFGGSGPEVAAEKTGPIVPVGAAPASDSETTGPIRRVPSEGPGGPAGWTLPGA